MSALAAKLRARIAAEGPLPLDAFMAACLADPDHGYYRGGDRLGRAGDFVTAPEISQIFGELLGLWAAEVWRLIGGPDPVNLVELGPGRGTLMADALRAIGKVAPAFRAALRVRLVEISPGFRAMQRAALGEAPTWHDSLDAIPEGPAIVLANEYFDALPVKQYVRAARGWRERCVTHDGMRFVFTTTAEQAEPPLAGVHGSARPGDLIEVSPAARADAAALARRIVDEGGAALIVDYGSAASFVGETLQAVHRHRPVDPLAEPGEADLTAHVDFAALAAVATASGARVLGPIPQGVFLGRLGLGVRVAALARAVAADQRHAIARAAQRLIDPAEMGTLFKAMAVVGANDLVPPGFEAP